VSSVGPARAASAGPIGLRGLATRSLVGGVLLPDGGPALATRAGPTLRESAVPDVMEKAVQIAPGEAGMSLLFPRTLFRMSPKQDTLSCGVTWASILGSNYMQNV
jgi:hypothetical protein